LTPKAERAIAKHIIHHFERSGRSAHSSCWQK